MARLRTTHKHLPKYVNVIHGAYWYRTPGQKAVRVGAVGDDSTLYQFLAKVSEPVGPITTMNQLFDKYCAEILPGLPSTVTQKFYLVCLKTLREVFGPAAPSDIRRQDVGRFLNAGKAKVMRRRQVAVLSTVMTHAADIWFIPGVEINPCYKLHAMKDDKKKKRKRYVSHEEYAAVYALMPQRVQIAMELSYLTAQRQKDILAWKWADADGLRMLVEQSKTGTRLSVRISERLGAALTEAKTLKPDLPRVYIVRQGKGKRAGQRYTGGGFRAIWQRIMAKYVAAGGVRFTFHDIRRKALSDAKSLQDAFAISGHSSIDLTRGVYDAGVREVEATK